MRELGRFKCCSGIHAVVARCGLALAALFVVVLASLFFNMCEAGLLESATCH